MAEAPVIQHVNSNLRLPAELNLLTGNVSENYKLWKRSVEIYLTASGIAQMGGEIQTATIINCGGEALLKAYDHFTWEEGLDRNNPVDVFNKIKDYCNPRQNEVAESHKFWTVQYFEPFDQFLTELRSRAASCNFGNQEDRMIRDKIVFSATGKIQQLLLRDDELTLQRAIRICQSYEQANRQASQMKEPTYSKDSNSKVNKIYNKPTGKEKSKQYMNSRQKESTHGNNKSIKECRFCGRTHIMKKESCPAWGKTCSQCNGRNHFKIKCKKKNLRVVGAEGRSPEFDYEENDQWLHAVSQTRGKSMVTASMIVNNNTIKFQLDSGADVNTINQRYVRKEQVNPTNLTLHMFNESIHKPLGETELAVKNPKTGEDHSVKFVVVNNRLQNILGLSSIQDLGLVTVNNERFIGRLESSSITKLGDLGEATLTLDPNIRPKVLPCRKLPLSLQDQVKAELDSLVERQIIVPITKPTQWVSQMAVAHKANGKLRICLDPQVLNTALQREHFKLPTLDDVLPKLNNARVFSKLDVKEAFWHIRLDEQSSEYTTMITPFGRYRWTRLPFGLKVSSEIFQRKLNEALEGLDGIFAIADDIIVVGKGSSDAIALEDNENKLKVLYQRCNERNIVLNEEKKVTGLKEILFHGHAITADGIKADPMKVEAILKMASPTDAQGVRRFCGMVQYMARFLPSLSTMMEPLREITRKDVEFNWTKEHEECFKSVKQALTTTPVLAYYDPNKELVIQVDSSKDGIGAVMLQNGKPVEYASRALTSSERRWAQIEKEALATLYGAERFDQYTYGRKIVIENDHKPLESILKKPLSCAPRRLQDIIMKLYRYDVEFRFLKGTSLVIADTLSRAFLDNARPRIMNIKVHEDIPDTRLEEIRVATLADENLQMLMDTIRNGWPESKDTTPNSCKPYFDVRDTLAIIDGLIVKGEAVVIPNSLRPDIKTRLHKSHVGLDATMRRARGTVYWPAMKSEIKQMVETCEACQEMAPRSTKPPLKQHDDGDKPWNKIGMDLFDIKGRQYLVTVDYYSNYIEVDYLLKVTSGSVINILKKQFARFGIPVTIVSDGGPQFTAREFQHFTKTWGIHHVTSSPQHQRANGKAESAVKVIKHLMLKCNRNREDQYEALMELRNVPRQDTGLSPNEMMFCRRTRTLLPDMSHTREENDKVKEKRESRKRSVKRYYDKTARDLPYISEGQNVYFQYKEHERWILGRVLEQCNDYTYMVQAQNGAVYRRNRMHIRPTKVEAVIRDKSPIGRNFGDRDNSCKDIVAPRPQPKGITNSESGNTANDVQLEQTCENTRPKPVVENSMIPLRRSGRERREPNHLKDFVLYK